MNRTAWKFTGRQWEPLMGDVLVWECIRPKATIPLRYVITPDEFWGEIL